MAHQHVETNPHFIDPEQLTPEQRLYLPDAFLAQRGHHRRPQDQPPQQPRHSQDERPQPLGPSPPQQPHEGQPHLPLHVWVPPVHHEDQHSPPQYRQGQQRQPLEMWMPPTSSIQGPAPEKQKRQDQHPSPSASSMRPQRHGGSTEHHPSLFLPRDRRTKPLTWSAAAFCIIFWLVIIIGGLVVLIVYLVFRPRSPLFDVNSVTLNAAYLDVDYLFNADLSLLANFTNPNKKVNVDFSSMYLDLYFENTLIATQYIEPFSAARGQSMFAYVHMATSQTRLSIEQTLLLQRQIENNQVMFTLKGAFRARSNLGGFLKYSYWLHGRCSIVVSSPPTGVLRDKICRTKR